MSSADSRSGERMVHQDYIARIHFSNALPPPPSLPKLLDIPNTGLRSGQYTTPNFASRLVREQPLNVEADAELGMPLNLVGMPGVFDGDERSIQAPAQAPPVHARDRPLLRPLSALGKPKVAEANVSFLRRTEYISSSTASRRPEAVRARAALLPRVRWPARPAGDGAEGPADSPRAIKRKIDRGFELAELDLGDAAKRVKHPSKKQVRLVEAVPLLPDLDAFPDSGAYVTIKFLTNPVSGGRDYDRRMLSALFRPIDRTSSEEALYKAALEAHERDPVHYAKPPKLMNYDFYLPQTAAVAEGFRRKLDVDDPEHDSDALYTHRSGESGGFFQFDRVRAYETAQKTELDHATKYDDEIILAYDAAPAYYYYPVMQRSAIRPQRTKNIARTTGLSHEGDEQIVDQLDITVEEPTEELRKAMKSYKEKPLGLEHEVVEPEAEVEAEPEAEPESEAWEQTSMTAVAAAETDVDVDAEGEVEGEVERLSRRSSAADRFEYKTPDEDRDAEGEADEEDEALQS